MTSIEPERRLVAAPSDTVAGLLILLVLPILLVPSPAGGTTAGRITGQVLINAEPAGGAVVFLQAPPGQPLPSMSAETIVRQEHLRFQPDFLVLPVGTTIRFENHDDEIHNIYSRAAENRFDTGAHLPGTVKEVVLKTPGVVPIRCRTHQSMRGLIIVTPLPFFSITDKKGQFEIPNVPAGRYRISAWHPRLTPEERAHGEMEVNLDVGEQTVQLRFTARASTETDLSEVIGRDWISVVDQIRTDLDLAITLWKNDSITAATRKAMTIQSNLYGESGLRDAITQMFGKAHAAEHDSHFDAVRKRIQGIGSGPTTEIGLKEQVHTLVDGLMADAQKMTAP